jgi:hypothetical protein
VASKVYSQHSIKPTMQITLSNIFIYIDKRMNLDHGRLKKHPLWMKNMMTIELHVSWMKNR